MFSSPDSDRTTSPMSASASPVPSDRSTDVSSSPGLLQSGDLLQGRREVWIQHGTDRYRLIHTRNGKLILQK
ncbi:MAG: hemin uptake protein HemP [Planctomycetota bacterium]|nr:hemin uptake protein HemP [Planctomycetota bacterium]